MLNLNLTGCQNVIFLLDLKETQMYSIALHLFIFLFLTDMFKSIILKQEEYLV